MKRHVLSLLVAALSVAVLAGCDPSVAAKPEPEGSGNPNPPPDGDCTMWGTTPQRNNVRVAYNMSTDFVVGETDPDTGDWKKETSKKIKWAAKLGSQTYGNPVIAHGKIFVGTNNGAGWLKRYAPDVDLGCLLAFAEADGKFLWQHSNEKLPTGRVHDWPQQGICSTAYVEGDRVWYVTSRGHVTCLDANGFHDGEDDGPVKEEWARQFDGPKDDDADREKKLAAAQAALKDGKLPDWIREAFKQVGVALPGDVAVKTDDAGKRWSFIAEASGEKRSYRIAVEGPRMSGYRQIAPSDKDEADVVWDFDMMKTLGVSQHNMCSCSVTAAGDLLFVHTSNGVDESHMSIPAAKAPSFLCLDKNSGTVLWSDNSPGENIVHGQWSSPTYAVIKGVPQVLFGGGDTFLRSFRGEKTADGKPELLWKFDCNPKNAKFELQGTGTRNDIIGTPVVYKDLIYIAVGQDPEHGEGEAHLWCIDPTKRGDVSPELAYHRDELKKPAAERKQLPHNRIQVVDPARGDVAIANPNSALVWRYSGFDRNGDGKLVFEEKMHRTVSTVTIKDDVLYIADFSGLFHCLNAKTGKLNWTHDMMAACWGSALIADDKVWIGDEDGNLHVFKHSADPKVAMKEVPDEDDEEKKKTKFVPQWKISLGNAVYSTPVVAHNVLYISNKNMLFAIEATK